MVHADWLKGGAILVSALMLMAPGSPASSAGAPGEDAAPEECISFAKATDFKVESDQQIRISIASLGDYDVDLGPQCAGLKDRTAIALRSVPAVKVCVGKQDMERLLTFDDTQSKPLTCQILGLSRAVKIDSPPLRPGAPQSAPATQSPQPH